MLLGSVFAAIPFILLYKGFERIKLQKGSIVIMLHIIFSIIFAFIIFKEVPSLFTIIGGLLIIIGNPIITINPKERAGITAG